MIQVAIALPLGCVLGWLAGSWLDRHFHQGWIGVTGILLGAVGGFIQIYRTATRYLSPGNPHGDHSEDSQ
jgi:uncharacterized membrane protein YeaQ/YmgE (transglycosylase-associated protein family)